MATRKTKPAIDVTTYSPEKFVYMGHRYLSPKYYGKHGGSSYVYGRLNSDGVYDPNDDGLRNYNLGKATPGVYVGGVYECHIDDEKGSMITGGPKGPKLCGRYADTQSVMRWQAEDRAADADKSAETSERAKVQRNEITEALAPIREAYRATNAQGRRALIAVVLEVITG